MCVVPNQKKLIRYCRARESRAILRSNQNYSIGFLVRVKIANFISCATEMYLEKLPITAKLNFFYHMANYFARIIFFSFDSFFITNRN